jgi:pyruvate/2-oxoglutarate dehydrogenase complex dihydrolipoamide acyltransferase (E2) component
MAENEEEEEEFDPYIYMEEMHPTMETGKVEKYLVGPGDTVKKGQPVAELVAEGYWTLTAPLDGVIEEIFIDEEEYVEVGTVLMEFKLVEK